MNTEKINRFKGFLKFSQTNHSIDMKLTRDDIIFACITFASDLLPAISREYGTRTFPAYSLHSSSDFV